MGNPAGAQTSMPLQTDGVAAYLFKAAGFTSFYGHLPWLTRRARTFSKRSTR
jgi:hypothetical protein